MRTISRWANKHIQFTRLLVVILHLAAITFACYLGYQIADEGIFFTPMVLYISLMAWICAAILYPKRIQKGVYKLRKTCDLILAASTFFIFTYATNTEGLFNSEQGKVYAATSIAKELGDPTASEILASLQYRDKSTLTKKEKRILKREFKKQIGLFVKAKFQGDDDGSGRAGLIILTIIAALGVLYLVAALACSLSCNGMDGAAIAVALLGTAGVVWATIAIIRRINRGPRNKEEPIPTN